MAKVNKELIEKYHLGLCSPEEEQRVENWLLEEGIDEKSLAFEAGEEHLLGEQMWKEIAADLSLTEQEPETIPLQHFFSPLIKKAIAASLIAGLLGAGVFGWWHEYVGKQPVVLSNYEETGSEKIQTHGLDIFLGPNSQANINASSYHRRGNIDFCGIIMINPNEDIELTLNATCKSFTNTQEKMTFKKGQKYIAVNYHFNTDNELIVVNERNIANLPTALQKEIMKQFNI